MSKQIGIYKIINIYNGKLYLGKSLLIKYRWKKHLWALKKGVHVNNHLQSAYNKYGSENFLFEILEYCCKSKVCQREKYWIKKLKSCNPLFGYNKTKGGDGLVATDEIKEKISKSLLGIKHSTERKLNQRVSQLGKKKSDLTKNLLSKLQIENYINNPERAKSQGKYRRKSIQQFSLKNKLVKTFISAREAERETGVDISSITKCCNNKGYYKSAGGFIWKYKEIEEAFKLI